MNPDGRKGKVFCLRLSDAERELIKEALGAEQKRRERERRGSWWWSISLGEFIRAAAVDRAKQLLEAGNTASSAETKKRKRSRR
jgi:hypothetical protein